MSISAALSSALSGIRAASRQAEAISSNVANATTAGYARRSVALTSLYLGGNGQGVRILGIDRHSNLPLLNDRRFAQATASSIGTTANFLSRLEAIVGTTETSGSLVSRVNTLDGALIAASANPESESRLTDAVRAAAALAAGLNSASRNVQAERLAADKAIAAAVQDLNTALHQVAELNTAISATTGGMGDPSALMDQRQQIIDGIADLVPIRQLQRDDGQIALISAGGAVLLDGKAAVFGFSGVNAMAAEMTLDGGALSGLTLNGKPIATSGSGNLIMGGHLGAQFDIRDNLAVKAQAQLDGVARDLIERFSRPGLDPSLVSGSPGLFTDRGGGFVPAAETGLAGRIAVNSALSVELGGTPFALRDGLGAVGLGQAGNASLLLALSEALTTETATGTASFFPGNRSAGGLVTELLSGISANRVAAQSEQAFGAARLAALTDQEHAEGVDVDQEMQSLLVIEKTYAANARVIQVVDEMLDLLLGI